MNFFFYLMLLVLVSSSRSRALLAEAMRRSLSSRPHAGHALLLDHTTATP
jgi:hypothetical protein